jgi:FMN phosphatase YigB (HAD superfamily)
MLEAVLIDLDNTMVLFDEPDYYRRYFPIIEDFFSKWCPKEAFKPRLIESTMALRNNPGAEKNREIFLDHFIGDPSEDRELVWNRFLSFYQNAYPRIEVKATIPEGLYDVLEALGKTDLKLVTATNPIFPLLAPQTRMGWVGIDPKWFHLITHIENMSAVKPRGAYYTQISEMIGVAPEQCLMVGNDPVNDMAAGRVGMKTYLTDDAELLKFRSTTSTSNERDSAISALKPDFSGPFSGVLPVVKALMD